MMVKKLISALFVLILVVGFYTPTYAAEANPENNINTDVIIQPNWTFINNVTVWMEIDSSGKASMLSDITAYSGIDQVSITARLQRYNGSWSTIKTWSRTYQGNSALWADTWYVNEGYLYRLQTYFGACDNYLWEYTTLTSGIVDY